MTQYIAVDLDGTILLFNDKPERICTRMKSGLNKWFQKRIGVPGFKEISKGDCIQLIGELPTWDDEPIPILY